MGLSGQCEIRSDGAGDEDRPVGSNHREWVRIQLPLTGIGTGPQLAIDGGSQTTVAATGLGTTSSVAVTSGGTVYIADPTNNRIVVEPVGGGAQTTITTVTGVTPATLSGPMGVAVDAANNVYIADTGNNRILEYNPITASATHSAITYGFRGPRAAMRLVPR